jgi:hypothetical protein
MLNYRRVIPGMVESHVWNRNSSNVNDPQVITIEALVVILFTIPKWLVYGIGVPMALGCTHKCWRF